MPDDTFDAALIAAAFELAARDGWPGVSVAAAARHGGLSLAEARTRFPGTDALLLRFGRLADEQALTGAAEDGPARERLFDIVMRRIDALQQHRPGVLALLRVLPGAPATALLLAAATATSMGWMLEAAGIASTGFGGALRTQGLVVVWLATMRAWERDDSVDLSATMAALDRALGRAGQVAGWIDRVPRPAVSESISQPGPKPFPDDPAPAAAAGI